MADLGKVKKDHLVILDKAIGLFQKITIQGVG